MMGLSINVSLQSMFPFRVRCANLTARHWRNWRNYRSAAMWLLLLVAGLVNTAAAHARNLRAWSTYLLWGGLLPSGAVLVGFTISLFVSRVPWAHKIIIGLALLSVRDLAMLAMLGGGSDPLVRELLFPSVLWWLPLAVWYGGDLLLARVRALRNPYI